MPGASIGIDEDSVQRSDPKPPPKTDPVDHDLKSGHRDQIPGEPAKPGAVTKKDFNDSANQLWLLYGKTAEKYDKDTLDDTTSDMEGLLLFVRSSIILLLRASPY